ncbi:MAG: hypothetical protein KA369_17425 [Spirochaetes bacterium]|nr:hypothetical protein [Spirochaetota bacterium]
MEHKKLFMGNLDFAVTEEELKTLLSDYGTVVNIKMRKKKGCAFIEMSDEAEAALAIEKLNGIMFKDREVRISLEIKASKAKAISINNYSKINSTLSGPSKNRTASRRPADSRHPQRKEWSPDKPTRQNRTSRDGHRSGYNGSPQPETNYNSRERFYDPEGRPSRSFSRGKPDSRHPQRKEWSHDKPMRPNRTARDGRGSGHGGPPKPDINYNTRERFPDPDERPPRSFSRGKSDFRHPQRKEWSHDKATRQNRTARDGHRSGYGGSPKPDINYNTRERFPDPDERPPISFSRGKSDSQHPRRKEWSHDKPARPGRPSAPSKQWDPGTRRDSRPKPSGGSPNRFSPSSGPKSGSRGTHNSSHSPGPKARDNAGNRGRNTRPKRD